MFFSPRSSPLHLLLRFPPPSLLPSISHHLCHNINVRFSHPLSLSPSPLSARCQAVQAENVTVLEGGTAQISCRLHNYDGSIVVIQNPRRQTLFFNGTRGASPCVHAVPSPLDKLFSADICRPAFSFVDTFGRNSPALALSLGFISSLFLFCICP